MEKTEMRSSSGGWLKLTRPFLFFLAPLVPLAAAAPPRVAEPADTVIVQSMFGGQIFGFDIDQAGNEGVLTESQNLSGGRYHAAIETFDQTTGAIIKVVKETHVP